MKLKRHEIILWVSSMAVVTASYIWAADGILSLIASLIGVTALIFIAKGNVLGQFLTVIFSVLYGIISFFNQYYGEMITYLGMTAPMAVMALISWIRHPFKDSGEVEVKSVTKGQMGRLCVITGVVTVGFYFILRGLGTARLNISTLSIATSFFAASLTYMRSPYYAVFYSANDLVLIIMWVIASREDKGCIPMIFCFVMFLANDMYGFVNWRRMERVQSKGKKLSEN